MIKKINNDNYSNIINKLKKKILKQEKELIFYKNENKRLEEELFELKKKAYTDSLTNLNNRRCLENIEGYDSLILGDIDHFKIINDRYGHIIGDAVLV